MYCAVSLIVNWVMMELLFLNSLHCMALSYSWPKKLLAGDWVGASQEQPLLSEGCGVRCDGWLRDERLSLFSTLCPALLPDCWPCWPAVAPALHQRLDCWSTICSHRCFHQLPLCDTPFGSQVTLASEIDLVTLISQLSFQTSLPSSSQNYVILILISLFCTSYLLPWLNPDWFSYI